VNHIAGKHDVNCTPSTGFDIQQVKMRKYVLEIYDIAGGEKLRNLWRHYYDGAKAMIFMVDSTNKARFAEAKEELKKIVHSPELTHLPILVFANKSDIADQVVPVAELSDAMELKQLLHGRQWAVLPCSAKTGEGLDDGLKWFVKTFKETAKADHK
jgi:small GTP-binding protein